MLRENPGFNLIKKYVYVSIKRLKSHVDIFPHPPKKWDFIPLSIKN